MSDAATIIIISVLVWIALMLRDIQRGVLDNLPPKWDFAKHCGWPGPDVHLCKLPPGHKGEHKP